MGGVNSALEQPGLSTGLRIAAVGAVLYGDQRIRDGRARRARGLRRAGTGELRQRRFLYALLTVLGGWLGQVEGAMTGVTISAVLQCILTWRAVASEANKQAVPIRFGVHDADFHILMMFALPAALNGFVSVPAIWFGHAVLVRQEGGYTRAMALFTAANNFRTIALFLPSVVNNVNYSLLSHQLGVPGGGGYVRVFWVNLTVTVAIAVGGAAAASISGPWLLGWFGEEFKAGYPVPARLDDLDRASKHRARPATNHPEPRPHLVHVLWNVDSELWGAGAVRSASDAEPRRSGPRVGVPCLSRGDGDGEWAHGDAARYPTGHR